MPPEPPAAAPVLPLAPDPLLVPAPAPVAVELPDEPMLELVPELEVAGTGVGFAVDCGWVDGVMVLPAEPPAEPMPEADPLVEPDIVGPELQAARDAAAAKAMRILFMVFSER